VPQHEELRASHQDCAPRRRKRKWATFQHQPRPTSREERDRRPSTWRASGWSRPAGRR
jgi:hypothetical protein